MKVPLTLLCVGLATALAAPALWGQTVPARGRYRDYVLESSVDAVRSAADAPASAVRTLHERPSLIQELDWRAPYTMTPPAEADPVRAIVFSFCDDRLYKVVVEYDRDRTDGLTDRDLVDALASVYGPPIAGSATRRANDPGQAVLAQWSSTAASVTLMRGVYSPAVQLLVASPDISTRAQQAITAAIRQDSLEAPRREAEQRRKDAAEASAVRDRQRANNKAAFRP